MKFFSVFGLFLDIVGSVIVLGGIAFQGNKTLGERGGTFIMDDDTNYDLQSNHPELVGGNQVH